jgi:hypothetical protein
MSNIHYMFDYVSTLEDKPKVIRKYIDTDTMTYRLDKFELTKKGLKGMSVFHGQRVHGYVRSGKYVVLGLFVDPNTYH